MSAAPERRQGRGGPPSGPRAEGRELALAALCHLEAYPEAERRSALELFWTHAPVDDAVEVVTRLLEPDAAPQAREYAEGLLTELLARWGEVDALIEDTSRRWRLERMAQVDRNVLRIAVVELQRGSDPPRNVAVAEAVRVASRYGSEQSGRFVNGLAVALADALRGAAG